MKRTLLVALFLCAAGCKKDEGPSPEAVDQAASIKPLTVVMPPDAGTNVVAAVEVDAGEAAAADAEADAEADAGADEEPNEAKIAPKPPLHTVTEADIQKFIVWRKKTEELAQVAQKEFKARSAAIQKAGGLQQQIELNRAVQELGAKKVQADELALQASGLDAKTAEWMRPFVWDVMGDLMLAKESGLDATVKQAEASMKTMNPEQRARAQADLAKLKETLANLVSLRDPRTVYGDANVDLVVKHEAELLPLYKSALDAISGAR